MGCGVVWGGVGVVCEYRASWVVSPRAVASPLLLFFLVVAAGAGAADPPVGVGKSSARSLGRFLADISTYFDQEKLTKILLPIADPPVVFIRKEVVWVGFFH